MIKKFFEHTQSDKLEDIKECFSDLIDDGFQATDWKFIQPPSELSKIKTMDDDVRVRLEKSIKQTTHNDSVPEEVMKLLIKNRYTILGYLLCNNYLGNIEYQRFHNMESLNRIYQLLDMKIIYISRRQVFSYTTGWSYQIDMIFRKF